MTTDQANPFTRAKEILGPDGENWGTACQWKDGKICVEQAIGKAGWIHPNVNIRPLDFKTALKANAILADVLTEQYPGEIPSWSQVVIPWSWNDARGRTPDEVLAMLDKGEARWDEGR